VRGVSIAIALILLGGATASAETRPQKTQKQPQCLSFIISAIRATDDLPTSSTPTAVHLGGKFDAFARDSVVAREYGTSAPLSSCCKPFTIREKLRNWTRRFTGIDFKDAYYAGNQLHESVVPNGYSFAPPNELRVDTSRIMPETVTFSPATAIERVEPYRKRLGLTAETTKIGQGATSEVFVVHEHLPGGQPGSRTWQAIARAFEAIKIKSAVTFGEVNLERAARYFRNDLSRYELARELVKHVAFKGEKLLEVAQLLSTRAEHAEGVLRQRIVSGPSVDVIQQQLDIVLVRKKVTVPEYMRAIKFLDETGIAPRGANAHLAHLEIQAKINAIESFYRHTDEIVRDYVNENKLEHYAATYKGAVDGEHVMVGFDFNHGQNVVWDVRARVFKMIDF
jgi:hypothetical protein